MFSLSQEELDELLSRNPSLSIAGQQPIDSAPGLVDKTNKYKNYSVYIFRDGYVLNAGELTVAKGRVREAVKQQTERHGPVTQLFDSTKEYKRYLELLLLEKAGKIENLDRQVVLIIQESFQYHGAAVRAIKYCADFKYEKDRKTIIEDVKGYDAKKKKWLTTQVFDLKWKLLKAKYPEYMFILI